MPARLEANEVLDFAEEVIAVEAGVDAGFLHRIDHNDLVMIILRAIVMWEDRQIVPRSGMRSAGSVGDQP